MSTLTNFTLLGLLLLLPAMSAVAGQYDSHKINFQPEMISRSRQSVRCLLILMLLTIIKKYSYLRWLFAIAFLGLSLSVAPANAADGPAGPGWMEVQGTPVTPQEADAHYQSISRFSALSYTPGSATTATPEITALARALQNDPKLIYDYVRNNVDYTPYFGSLKGATLTYLEGSGNDFDQASLMIALLRASGITAQYVYGTMSIPAYGDLNQKTCSTG